MITVPLPQLADLWSALLTPNPANDALGAAWSRKGERSLWFSRGATALAALASAGRNGPARVWVPDFFCNQSLAPLRAGGHQLIFYPITETLAPDWEACRALMAATPPDLFLLVHYFGVANESAVARAFVDEAGGRLVEDGAHVLNPRPGIGESGDAVLYCPHKWLAVPDGSVLVFPPRAASWAAAVGSLEMLPASGGLSWMAKRLIQSTPAGNALMRRRHRHAESFLDDPSVLLPPRGRMTSLARRLLSSADLAAVAERREQNRTALAAVFETLPRFTVLDTPNAGYRLILQGDSLEVSQSLFHRVRKAGLGAETWPDMAPEVMAAPSQHSTAIRLRRTRVYLPVHQSLEPAGLAAAYREALAFS